MQTILLDVQGMHFGGCVKRVSAILHPLPGVTAVEVDLAAERISVHGDLPQGGDALAKALTDGGYTASVAVGAPATPKASGGCCG